MSQIISLIRSVDLLCPHCEELTEDVDIDVSVTIWGTDVSRPKEECCFTFECDHCGQPIKVIPHLDIDIQAA